MNQGMVVTASDYQPNGALVVGKMAASDALDVARAGTQLMTRTFANGASPASDMFIWGHSQGGHAARWAGQLAESYYAVTKPTKLTAALKLIGVAALAPASNFVTLTNQPGVQAGDGLADWEMHKNKQIQAAVAFCGDVKANRMLVDAVWNLPAGYKPGQYFKGGLDRTCASTTDTGVLRWCAWMGWKTPGPLGTSS